MLPIVVHMSDTQNYSARDYMHVAILQACQMLGPALYLVVSLLPGDWRKAQLHLASSSFCILADPTGPIPTVLVSQDTYVLLQHRVDMYVILLLVMNPLAFSVILCLIYK
jgi:hypothetical protein